MKTETTSIELSSGAVERIQSLLPEQNTNHFRIYVTGGGCSGFQYGFKFDESPGGDDDVIEFKDFVVLLDSLSYPYLYGATLDYIEDLSGSRFGVTNPNAKTTCGCGESFTI